MQTLITRISDYIFSKFKVILFFALAMLFLQLWEIIPYYLRDIPLYISIITICSLLYVLWIHLAPIEKIASVQVETRAVDDLLKSIEREKAFITVVIGIFTAMIMAIGFIGYSNIQTVLDNKFDESFRDYLRDDVVKHYVALANKKEKEQQKTDIEANNLRLETDTKKLEARLADLNLKLAKYDSAENKLTDISNRLESRLLAVNKALGTEKSSNIVNEIEKSILELRKRSSDLDVQVEEKFQEWYNEKQKDIRNIQLVFLEEGIPTRIDDFSLSFQVSDIDRGIRLLNLEIRSTITDSEFWSVPRLTEADNRNVPITFKIDQKSFSLKIKAIIGTKEDDFAILEVESLNI